MQPELRHDNHTVSLLLDHIVWSPKYRRRVLVDEITEETDVIIRIISYNIGIDIIRLSVSPDHVHLLYTYPPKYSVSYVAHRIKGASSRHLRLMFPELKQDVKLGSLWAASCFHASVGQTWEIVEAYIKNQQI